jgi:phospholipase C
VYDEHGGIFDHVPPPTAVNPDGLVSLNPPFSFDRLGVRVPALLVSPHVGRGIIDSTVYDHTSILATVRELFNLPNALTQRDRTANTASRNLEDPPPRTDAPSTLPRPPQTIAGMFHADGETARMTADHVVEDLARGEASTAPLSEFQASLVGTANALQTTRPPRTGVLTVARLVQNEHEGAVQVRDVAARLLDDEEQ